MCILGILDITFLFTDWTQIYISKDHQGMIGESSIGMTHAIQL